MPSSQRHLNCVWPFVFGAATAAAAAANPYSFVSIGDWGGHAVQESTYAKNTEAVAAQLKKSADALDAKFVIGTGDNFYWCGIQNISDYQVKADFVDVYLGGTGAISTIPWYHALGNHEYGYNVSAQLDLNSLIPTWHLPARYYTQRVEMTSTEAISFIFLDSSPCVQAYRSTDNSEWDPCGAMYPTCSITGGPDPFEGTCRFHQNIVAQDCAKQFSWFQKQLAAVPKDDWLVIVAHHPADEIDVQDFFGAAQAHGGWHLWLNGHAHTLTHYAVDGVKACVTTGAGSMVKTADQLGGTPAKDRTKNKVDGVDLEPYNGHSYQTIWNQKVAGFTTHSFSADFRSLTTNFVTAQGETVHSFSVRKSGAPSSAPAPSPAQPRGDCCFSASSCTKGQTCCKSGCSDPTLCSYTERGCHGEYGQKHGCTWTGTACVIA